MDKSSNMGILEEISSNSTEKEKNPEKMQLFGNK
jgi:hypothetical protein